MPSALKQLADKMTTDFPTAPSAYGLNGPSAAVTVEKSILASHTEILTSPVWAARFFEISVPGAIEEHFFNGLLNHGKRTNRPNHPIPSQSAHDAS